MWAGKILEGTRYKNIEMLLSLETGRTERYSIRLNSKRPAGETYSTSRFRP